jgi:hypothetical protein
MCLPLQSRGSLAYQVRFNACLPDLLSRGLPGPDSTTGNHDLKAVEAGRTSDGYFRCACSNGGERRCGGGGGAACGYEAMEMATVKIKYYRVRKGRGYWIHRKDAGVGPSQDRPLRGRWRSGMGDSQRVERPLAGSASRTRAPTEERLAEGSLGEGFPKYRKSATWKR